MSERFLFSTLSKAVCCSTSAKIEKKTAPCAHPYELCTAKKRMAPCQLIITPVNVFHGPPIYVTGPKKRISPYQLIITPVNVFHGPPLYITEPRAEVQVELSDIAPKDAYGRRRKGRTEHLSDAME